jgi:hypothetical protein
VTQEAERSGRLRFKASLGKQFTKPYLENTYHKKKTDGIPQGVGPEFKPQDCKTNLKKREI